MSSSQTADKLGLCKEQRNIRFGCVGSGGIHLGAKADIESRFDELWSEQIEGMEDVTSCGSRWAKIQSKRVLDNIGNRYNLYNQMQKTASKGRALDDTVCNRRIGWWWTGGAGAKVSALGRARA